MNSGLRLLIACLCTSLFACSEVADTQESEAADYIFKGSVYTSDDANPWASGIAVKGMSVYIELQQKGELTGRAWMRADLPRAAEFNMKGIKMRSHPATGKADSYLG